MKLRARRCSGLAGHAVPAGQQRRVAPLPHGGVYFEWRGPQRALEVHIDPEGRLGYLAVMQVGGDETFAEADAVSTETILNLLARTLSPESMA